MDEEDGALRDIAAWDRAADEDAGNPTWLDVERAYRRGYQQAWSHVISALRELYAAGMTSEAALRTADEHGSVLYDWRYQRSLHVSEYPPRISSRFMRRTPLDWRDRVRLIEQAACTCFYCGAQSASVVDGPGNAPWHIDHRVPVVHGGSNHPANLVVSCQTCNLRKQSKGSSEWQP